MKNKLLFHLGNALILLSVAGFVFTLYPLFIVYFGPEHTVQKITAQKGTFITIPKIHAQSKVVENVDPWNQSVYDEALKDGVAHAKDTSLPGQKGTSYLFAHSSGMPWELTHQNTIFLRLGELQNGDTIEIVRNGKTVTYNVTGKKEVDPSEVHYLLDNQKAESRLGRNQLILQTCTPIGTSLRRLLIFAKESK